MSSSASGRAGKTEVSSQNRLRLIAKLVRPGVEVEGCALCTLALQSGSCGHGEVPKDLVLYSIFGIFPEFEPHESLLCFLCCSSTPEDIQLLGL